MHERRLAAFFVNVNLSKLMSKRLFNSTNFDKNIFEIMIVLICETSNNIFVVNKRNIN